MSNITSTLKPEQWMVEFLEKTSRYFANRPTGGEDRAYWANVYNSDNCQKIADYLKEHFND
jgi:hypothetical protein